MLNIDSIIESPKTLTEAIETLCIVLSYDIQGWIKGLEPEQAEWLCESDLSTQVLNALVQNGDNRALIADCESTDAESATRRIIVTLWFHLKTSE